MHHTKTVKLENQMHRSSHAYRPKAISQGRELDQPDNAQIPYQRAGWLCTIEHGQGNQGAQYDIDRDDNQKQLHPA